MLLRGQGLREAWLPEGWLSRESLRAVERWSTESSWSIGVSVAESVGVPVAAESAQTVELLFGVEAVRAAVEREGAWAVDDAAAAPVAVSPNPLVPVCGQRDRR